MKKISFQTTVNPSDAYYRFGQAMKKYAIAQWISLGVGIIYVIITYVGIFAMMSSFIDMEDYSYYSTFGMISPIGGFSVFSWVLSIVMLGIGILVLVRYIQYLLRLKEATDISQSTNLQQHYKFEIWSLILSIVLPIIAVIAVLGLFVPLVLNSTYISINPVFQLFLAVNASVTQASYTSFLGIMILILIILLIFGILLFVFRVLSVLRLDDWASELLAQYGPNMAEIKEGTNLIKWGVIIAIIPIASSVSTIVTLIGFTKAGKAIENTFAGGGFSSGSEFASYTSPAPGTLGTSGTPSGPNASGTTIPSTSLPQTNGAPLELRCPYCGALIPSKDAKFCGVCGNALR
ncbi:MAG: hypothetical protein DRO88_00840 [Promethearchaeia archaeon]|nr:MAG: hypothetical protein DRO88_00840 [Candidatus Lokiarchaeia archaeon]